MKTLKEIRLLRTWPFLQVNTSALPMDITWYKDRSAQNRFRLLWLLGVFLGTMAGLVLQYWFFSPGLGKGYHEVYKWVDISFGLISIGLLLLTIFSYRRWSVSARDRFALTCAGTIMVCGTILAWLDNQHSTDISAWIAAALVPPVMLRLDMRKWIPLVLLSTFGLALALVMSQIPDPGAFNYPIFLVAPLIGIAFGHMFESGFREAWHYRNLLEKKNSELHEISLRDGLTGAFNRRAFDEILVHSLAGTQRDARELCLIMIDIDHFKKINDAYGHPMGDAVLRHVAEEIHDSIRASDLLSRYGGEEFVVILASTTLNDAQVVAERIRARVMNRTHAGFFGTVTVSLGLAGSIQAETPETLIQLADQALYAAKSQGRNRTVVSDCPARFTPPKAG